MEILFCPKCTLSQLSVVVDPEILYRRYLYCTNNSQTMRRHFDRLLKDIESEQGPTSSVLEIGSNEGSLLKFCAERGCVSILGIDPARNLAAMAENSGVPTIPEFFNSDSARTALSKIGNPSVILARHCVAHMHDLREFVRALEIVAGPKTLISIEIPWVADMLRGTEFDTAYFEHLSYFSLASIAELVKDSPFRIHRICHYSIHGGALLVMMRHKDSNSVPHLSADEYLSESPVTFQHWERFSDHARLKIDAMRMAVQDLTHKGKRVCGFGASAKASVWVSACGFTEKELLFVSDNSPLKPGRLMPGTHIPIIEQGELLSEHPDYAVIFSWNFRAESMAALEKWRQRGGLCIFPTADGVEIV